MIAYGVAWTTSSDPRTGQPLPFRARCRDCGACVYYDAESRERAHGIMRAHLKAERSAARRRRQHANPGRPETLNAAQVAAVAGLEYHRF